MVPAEIEVLPPQMSDALGPDAARAAEAGSALSVEQAIDLATTALREAATDSES